MNTVRGSTDVADCKCIPGYEGSDGEACIPCPYGSYYGYNDTEKASVCVQCPANSNTTEEGAASISDCLCKPGTSGTLYMSPSRRVQGRCIPCPRGMFKSDLGSFDCESCPDKTKPNTEDPGSTSADDCVSSEVCAAHAWCVK